MTSFGWKKKTPHLQKTNSVVQSSSTFSDSKNISDNSDDSETEDTNHDWLKTYKKRKVNEKVENIEQKIIRLKNEGIKFAENEEYWQAIGRWDEALKILQNINLIDITQKIYHEMKSQAFIQLHEWEPAIESAKLALKVDPNWYSAHQTLGRAYLGVGNVLEAVRAFSRARHICPQDEEIKVQDLEWANSLLTHKKLMAAAQEINKDKEMLQ